MQRYIYNEDTVSDTSNSHQSILFDSALPSCHTGIMAAGVSVYEHNALALAMKSQYSTEPRKPHKLPVDDLPLKPSTVQSAYRIPRDSIMYSLEEVFNFHQEFLSKTFASKFRFQIF